MHIAEIYIKLYNSKSHMMYLLLT